MERNTEQSQRSLSLGLRDEGVELVHVPGCGSMDFRFIRSVYVNLHGKGMIRNACVPGADITKELGIVS